MKKYAFVVLTNAVAGRDEEFNSWYDGRHVGDILRIPGFTSAKRYKASAEAMESGSVHWRYLTIYGIATDNLSETLNEMLARAGTSEMPLSDTLDLDGAHAIAYEEL